MALSRALFNDVRTAFRMLEEPFFHSSPRALYPSAGGPIFNPRFFEDIVSTPKSLVKEEQKHYLVEAELPGVKKSDLKVEFADGGETLHITGTRGTKPSTSDEAAKVAAPEATDTTSSTSQVTEASARDVSANLTSSPADTRNYQSWSSSFRFARPVDVEKVEAKLEDGILTLKIPKLDRVEGRRSITIS